MSTPAIIGLGAIAGLTIFLGLPLGRVSSPAVSLRVVLNAIATGILLFLFWDVLSEGFHPLDVAVGAHHWGATVGYAALFFGGITVGLMSLVYYDRWLKNRLAARRYGPGAANVAELSGTPVMTAGRRLALLIAVGIGLHNFGEGLAIGQSARSGEIKLAILLIVGFALHNATEGFGIVAPLAAEGTRPTWGYLAMLGLIGGGPTFLGTIVGQAWSNAALSVLFFTLAAGSILYVVIQLLGVGAKLGRKELMMWGLLGGLVLGFATDIVVGAAGA